MASTSYSPIQKSFKYDVFLSFRGEDTRNNFVGHLYQALKQKGIETYKDDEKIEKGKTIDDQLIKSIEDSRFYIIVLSKNYASSSWCLDELVKIMECQKTREQTAYPIFFDVEPTEVRKQSGAVKEAFAKHEKEEAAGKWRETMKEASNLAGWELKATANGDESKLIHIIVDVIFERLSSINFSVDGKLVGMETRIKEILSILEMGTQDVRIIGITGMGGGGKTTLAEAVCDKISLHFEGISFVENVRVVSKESLSGLQKQILADVLNKQDIIVSSVRNGKKMMGNMMRGRKVLIVLDDVDHKCQLEALAGDLNWFKSGSRIIITTRDEQVLVSHGVSLICNVNLLTDEEAICLFRRYASGKEILSQGCNEMSRQVVRYAAGLPLTIKVLGSSLRGKSELEWKDALERLEKVPEHETQEILKISYDALENDYREIFLDVACILKGEQKDKAIRVLESCGFHAFIGLSVLEKKSLISISKYGSLGMHDRIEEMGKYIDCHLHPDEHNRHSRLWIEKEIEDILDNNRINEAIRCIKLSPQRLDLRTFMTGLRNMKKVRVLYMCSGSSWDDSRVSQLFPNSLRYLCWRAYPFSSLHETFQADNLVGLDMSFSSNLQFWLVGKGKALTKLRFLDLSHTSLRRLNLELTPNLERLDLADCWNLEEINAPAGCLKNLLYLDLSGSGRFKSFLFDKQSKSLIVESKDKCALHPYNNLPTYNFTCLYKEDQAASSLGNLEKLISIELCACTNFESFSRSICSLQCIRKLTLEGDITEVPKDLHQLLHLEELYLSKSKIKYLPDSICRLKQLKYINFEDCDNLEKLPEDFGQLDSLEELILSNSKIKQLPDSVYMLKQLKIIKLQGCKHLERLPETFGQSECQEKIGRLGCLQELDITGTAISHLPQCILRLKGVRIIGSKMMLKSFGLTPEIQSSDNETFVYITPSTSSIRKLYSTNSIVDGKLVGMETRISDVLSSLEIGTQDVRMIGIKGMGGGGKTTLARAVYDQISNHFQGKSFVDNVREVSKPSLSGLKKLQKRVLKDVLNKKKIIVSSVHDGKNMLKDIMSRRKTLVVLDDVDCIEQLEALAGEPNWFKSGSRLIITTRDEQVLLAHGVNFVHDVNLLSSTEAICLFSRYAFQTEIPIRGYEELSRNVVRYAHGLPLTIKLLGSFLCDQRESEWKDAIERLKTIPLKETLDKLELSYISLEEDYKEIFLDVACIVKGWDKEKAIMALESRGFRAKIGLRVLEQRSLITYNEDGGLGMHAHLEEMGRNIVRRSHPHEPQRHSRLWVKEEIEYILANKLGTPATQCLYFDSEDFSAEIAIKGLAKMKDLKVLDIWVSDKCDDKVSEYYLPSSLQFMRWQSFPFSSLPNTFQGKHLVGLEIYYSKFVQLWEDREEKVLYNLRFFTIKDSRLRTFDLRLAPNLERLTIFICKDFVELHIPADHHSKLKHLDLRFSKLTNLHLRNAPNLKTLELEGCFHLVEFQMPAESLKLEHLALSHSKLTNLHLGSTPNLKKLILDGCNDLVELIMPSECLKLEELHLSRSKLTTIHLGSTPNLKKLILDGCNDLVELVMPSECLKLKELNLSRSKLRTLDLGLTPNLKWLKLKNCYDLVELKAPVGCLSNLAFLDLSGCGSFKSFLFDKQLDSEDKFGSSLYDSDDEVGSSSTSHDEVGSSSNSHDEVGSSSNSHNEVGSSSNSHELGSLCELHLIAEPTDVCPLHSDNDSPKFQFSCYYKEDKASSFGNLERLISLGLCACTNLESFSTSICSLQGIRRLTLEGSITEAPRDLHQLQYLEELSFSSTEIKYLPDSICMLKHLKSLKIESCWLLEKLPDDIGRLEYLEKLMLTDSKLLQDIPNSICKMKCINNFVLRGCIRVVELPEEIGCLEGMKELNIEGTGITRLPQSIFKLRGLRIVGSIRLIDTHGLLLKRRRTSNDDEIVYYI